MSARCFVGTSGWNYKHWSHGIFYPQGLKQTNWLRYYCKHFNSVEINNTFYRLPATHVFETWHNTVPKNFTFTVKASRFITHMKKLTEPEKHVALFLEHVSCLKEKLGIVLFQMPPRWKFNKERLNRFFDFISEQDIIPDVRSALEIRHESWNCEECFHILRKYNVALAFTDWPELKIEFPPTADFVFMRRHGPAELYASQYSDSFLRNDASVINQCLAGGKDVYIYFNNDAFGYAVNDALKLRGFLGKAQ